MALLFIIILFGMKIKSPGEISRLFFRKNKKNRPERTRIDKKVVSCRLAEFQLTDN